jgi:uncharacterized membrane protein
MYSGLFHGHSGLRYLVLVLLLVVIVRSFAGFLRNKPFGQLDNALSLGLLITTHIQFLLGLILYFVSPNVQFTSGTMKDATLRYWAVEHLVGMLIAVVLITIARSTSKRMKESLAKHKRLAIFNSIALIIIIATILQSGRTVFFFF